MNRYDAIVIGTGQAGPSLAARLAGTGMHVAVIERGSFGGTCVNNGCTPTKTLVASAYAAHLARRASAYGVEAGSVKVDMARVKARKDALVERSTSALAQWLSGLPNTSVYRGQARFVGPRTVTVIEMAPRLVAREDQDVSDAIREILAAEDIDIRLNARCITLAAAPEGVRVELECA